MAFCKGSIVRIYLENFQAFDEMELRPDNKLNLLIGANGSGKSTFICAIVLGLGGKPTIIGRSPNLPDYVKHGRDKALIELELYNPQGDNYTISREIPSKGGQSAWRLQGRQASHAKVEELISSLNIQINNLCQILPQDRVQDFAKMNPRELLDNTLKSVGDTEMYDWFHQLKTFRTSILDREKTVEDKMKRFESEQQKHKRMESDVKTYQEKQDVINKIQLLKQKLQWLLYEEKLDAKKQVEGELRSANEAYSDRKSQLQPLLKQITEAENSHVQLQRKVKAEKNHLESVSTKLKEHVRSHQTLCDRVNRIKQELRAKLNAEAERESQISEIQNQIGEMENNLPSMDESELLGGIKSADAEIEGAISRLGKVRGREGQARDRSMVVNQAVRAVEHKIQQLNSIKERKLEVLGNMDDVRQAYQWLETNRDKFYAPVRGPMYLELNVKDSNKARFFEHIISWKDLVAFVCDDARDVTNLLKILRDGKKLKINVIHSEPPERDLRELFRPDIPISQLRGLGFESYLLDLIEGPPSLLRYLCTSASIHRIPVGSSLVENNIEAVPKEVRFFFSETSFFKVSYSKYSREKSLSASAVIAKSKFLSFSVNQELLATCQRELGKKAADYQAIEREIAEILEVKNRIEVELNGSRNKKRELARSLEHLKAYNVRLRLKREELAGICQSRVDPVQEQARVAGEVQKAMKELVINCQAESEVIREHGDTETSLCLTKLSEESQRKLVKSRESEARELEAFVIQARDEVEKLKNQVNQLQSEVRAAQLKAKELTSGLDMKDERFRERYGTAFQSLPAGRDQLEEQLHETTAMAHCFQGSLDHQILEEYEASKKQLKRLEREIESLKASSVGLQTEATDTYNLWLPRILELIDSINNRFCAFFMAMNCAGVVELDKGPDPLLYENYGLSIRVKFRNEGDLLGLDAKTQSGGERALTTAVYLLSLQAITSVPFRCVDEINQGMDEINEKRVYHLILNSISSADTAQYFLVTPTLFPNVAYPEGTCTHCIHSAIKKEDDDGTEERFSMENYYRTLKIIHDDASSL